MDDREPTSKKHRRGGQPGNLNSLRHGFYSRDFHKIEHSDLEAMLENGLDSEINLLRVYTRRLLKLTEGNTDIDKGVRVLSALSISTNRLATLLRTQALLGGSRRDDILRQIKEGLTEVHKELFKE
jgi:hypothetical protein